MYECRRDERIKTKTEKSTLLAYTGLLGEREHLKINTRLVDIFIINLKVRAISFSFFSEGITNCQFGEMGEEQGRPAYIAWVSITFDTINANVQDGTLKIPR